MTLLCTTDEDEDMEIWIRHRMRKRMRREQLTAVQHRRCVAAVGVLIDGGQGPHGQKYFDKQHFIWEDHVRRLTEQDFKLRYRLDFDSFNKLLDILRDSLSVSNEKHAKWAKWLFFLVFFASVPVLSSTCSQPGAARDVS